MFEASPLMAVCATMKELCIPCKAFQLSVMELDAVL